MSSISDLMAKLEANAAAGIPRVNPPEATEVLAAVEAEPEPVPEPQAEPQPEPRAEPRAEEVHRDDKGVRQPPKKRRVASVIQAELDAALIEISRLEDGVTGSCTKELEAELARAWKLCAEAEEEIKNLNAQLSAADSDKPKVSEISIPMIKTEDIIEELKTRGYARVILEM